MTAKEYLKKARYLDELIDSKLRELERLKDLSKSISGSNFESHYNPNRPTEAPFEKWIGKVDETEREISNQIYALLDLKTKIEAAVSQMKNPEEQVVLRRRYIDGFSWELIGRKMNISERTVRRIHGSALQHFIVPE